MSYIYDMTDTWNAAGTVFSAIKMNVTDSASATGSKLIDLQLAGNSLFNVDKTGNVGIGTSSPTAYSGYTSLEIDNATNGGILSIKKAGSVVGYLNGASGLLLLAQSNDLKLTTTGSTSMQFSTNATERMRIDSSGNVGIGTTTPTAGSKLHIYGASPRPIVEGSGNGNYATWKYISKTSGGAAVNFEQGVGIQADNAFEIYDNQNAGLVSRYISGGSGYWSWFTNGSERMRIDSSGNLLVGTTALAPDSGFSFLSSGYTTECRMRVGHTTGTASGSAYAEFLYAAGTIGSITQNGTTAVAYNTSSDYRLKDIDGPVQNSGAYIDALKPVQGSWKADGSRFIGLIAHEVQEVSETQIATGVKDGDEMQAMDYSAPELIANLIAEIQSLRARVAQLEGN